MSLEELSLDFDDARQLYEAYMPFVRSGGIFVQTSRNFAMGQRVTLSISLPDSLEPDLIEGAVVWITPKAAHNSTPRGVGFGFIKDKHQLASRIEKMIGTLAKSGERTNTV